MTADQLEKYLMKVAFDLGEHFEHVQIMASWNADGLTHTLHKGCGNWYARQGMAHHFINQDIAQDNAHELADLLREPPEESESWKNE